MCVGHALGAMLCAALRCISFQGVTEKAELVALAREAHAIDAEKKTSTPAKHGPAPPAAAAAGPPAHLLTPKCAAARDMIVGFDTWRGPCRSVEVYEKMDNLGTGCARPCAACPCPPCAYSAGTQR
jgi:hypothetical protein